MTMTTGSCVTEADRAEVATSLATVEYPMGQLRTGNKRHNRAIAALQARKKLAEAALAAGAPAIVSAD